MKPSPDVWWYVEFRGVTVCNRDGKKRQSIPYPMAGLWALIGHGNYNAACAVELMSVLMSVDRVEAAKKVQETITEWKEAGFITEE